MKKIISIIALLAVVSLCLFSCELFGDQSGDSNGGGNENQGGDQGADTPVYDGSIYSPDTSATVIKGANAPEYVNSALVAMVGRIQGKGVSVFMGDDSASATTPEIALGETTREASALAKALADSEYETGGIAYAVVYKNGTLAVVGADEESFAMAIDYFTKEYLMSSTLKVDASLSYSFSMTADEYSAYLEEIAEEAWDGRFDELKEYISDDAIRELKRMYSLFDEDLYLWLANLWDSETGAFYYSCSARDYEGFFPDVESTCQALKIVCGSGMLSEWGGGLESLDAAIPEEMQEKILNFVFSLYCDEDGYFYHPQWGQGIKDDRKGRDLTWSLQIIQHFGSTLPEGWVDAITRLENKNAATASVIGRSSVSAAVAVLGSSTVKPVASDGRFDSEANFIKYLDSIDILGDPYPRGHMIASQADQIKAAGYLEVCLEYLNELQDQVYNEQIANGQTPSGVWSPDVSYRSVSGFFKLSVIYNKSTLTVQRYLNYVVDSCIECILSTEEPGQTVYVYNPWAALGEAVSAMKRANSISRKNGDGDVYDIDATYAKIRAHAADMFRATYDKASVIRKPDGGYSYYTANSASSIQGVYASLGLAEGDVNATGLLVYHMMGYMKGALGFTMPDIWNRTDFDRFMEEIDGVEPVEKKSGKTSVSINFDDMTEGEPLSSPDIAADSGTSYAQIIEDPEDSANAVLSLYSPATEASGIRVYSNMTAMKPCFVFSADFNMQSKTSGTTHQISFYNSGNRSFMLTLLGNTKIVNIGTASNVKGAGVIQEKLDVAIPVGEWFNLKVEIYAESEIGFVAKIFVNNEYVCDSQNFFGKESSDTPLGSGMMNYIWIYNLITPEAELLIDNIEMYYDDLEYEAP